jgi:hypothetical protein
MRLTILGLLLCTGIPAFCQSGTPPALDFSKLPPGWRPANVAPLNTIIQTQLPAPRRLDNAQIDPKIIVHPPQSSVGVQPPGTPVAQNEYPHLQLVPIESAHSIPQAVPTRWPRIQLEKTPPTSSNLDFQPTPQVRDRRPQR